MAKIEDGDDLDLDLDERGRSLRYLLKRNELVLKNVERNTSDGSAALAQIVGSGDKPGIAERLRDVVGDVESIIEQREEEARNRQWLFRILVGQTIASAIAIAAWIVTAILNQMKGP